MLTRRRRGRRTRFEADSSPRSSSRCGGSWPAVPTRRPPTTCSPRRCWSAGAGSTSCPTSRCPGPTAWPATAWPTPSAGARRQERVAARIAVVDPPRDHAPDPARATTGLRRGAAALRARGRRAAAAVGLGAADAGRDRGRPRRSRPTPRASGCTGPGRSCATELRKIGRLPDMRSRKRGGGRERRPRTATPSCATGCAPPTRPPPCRRPTPTRVARLLEDTMSHRHSPPSTPPSPGDRDPRPQPLTWLVAAAAVLVIAGVGALRARRRSDDAAATVPTAGGTDPTVTRALSRARPRRPAKCMVPDRRVLAKQEIAFDGTVAAIADGDWSRSTSTHFYRGGPTDQVTVDAPPGGRPAGAGPGGATSSSGERYLVSATDGFGHASAASPRPSPTTWPRLYAEAFRRCPSAGAG